MQYVKKTNEPHSDWRKIWFWSGMAPSYEYGSHLPARKGALNKLLEEQSSLCAYCQRQLDIDTSSIEHVIPRSKNPELSTNYFNLVAVCKSAQDDQGNRFCEPARGNSIIAPLIFYDDFQCDRAGNHPYLTAKGDGYVHVNTAASKETVYATEVFCEILNLNHPFLVNARRRVYDTIEKNSRSWKDKKPLKEYWEYQLERVTSDKGYQHRQFLLMMITQKLRSIR